MGLLISLSFLETEVTTQTTGRLHEKPLPGSNGSSNVTEVVIDLSLSDSQGIGDFSLAHGLIFEKGYNVATNGH